MHGRKRLAGALIGLLLFIAFALGVLPIPTAEAFVGDGLGGVVVGIVLVLAIIIASLSGALARARHMMSDPGARTPTGVMGAVVAAIVGVVFVALVVAAILR